MTTSDAGSIPSDLQLSVENECINACCNKQHGIIFSCLAVLIFIWFMVSDVANATWLTIWFISGLTIVAGRFCYTLLFSRLPPEKRHAFHANIFTAIMLVWGCHMALGTLFFFPLLTVLEQATWFAMFMAMIASSSSSHAVHLPAFYAFSFPYFLGMWWSCVVEFPSEYHINAIIFTFIMISQAASTHKSNRTTKESFRLRFENVDLIEDLKIEKEAAEKANNAKSKFLAAASHDLRQPLHALTLFSSALEDSLNDKTKAIELIGQINDSVDALQGLFNALLDISRLDAGTLICDNTHFNSSTLFEKLQNDFSPLAKEKQLSMHWDMTPVTLYTDPTLLELILRNLVSNALRYTSKGEIQITLAPENEKLCISVADTGIGIQPEKQSLIFDEFVQLHNPERDRTKGLGLGLSIVKRVAKLIESDIHIESTFGEGTVFSITVQKGDPTAIEQQVDERADSIAPSSTNVVVVDDEVAILQGMKSLLEGWGYGVVVAGDVDSAISLLDKSQIVPDSIVADYRLRENKTGVEAIKKIREHYGIEIPALIVSGDIAQDRLQQIKNDGLEMLHKPLKPARLRSFLNNQIPYHQ